MKNTNRIASIVLVVLQFIRVAAMITCFVIFATWSTKVRFVMLTFTSILDICIAFFFEVIGQASKQAHRKFSHFSQWRRQKRKHELPNLNLVHEELPRHGWSSSIPKQMPWSIDIQFVQEEKLGLGLGLLLQSWQVLLNIPLLYQFNLNNDVIGTRF